MADEAHSLEDIKSQLIKQVYAGKADAVQALRRDIAKVAWEARKGQIAALEPVFSRREEVVKGIEKFWSSTLQKSALTQHIEEADIPLLDALTSLRVSYSTADPREYTLTLHLAENAFTSDSTLEKKYTVPQEIKKEMEYDLAAPVVGSKVTINWKDDAHNLVKKSPRPNVSQMEEYDEFASMGSFFNFFTETEDNYGIADQLCAIYDTALDVYAGFDDLEGDDEPDSDDEDEEDEDEDDPQAEVDLGDSEEDMPSKKRARN